MPYWKKCTPMPYGYVYLCKLTGILRVSITCGNGWGTYWTTEQFINSPETEKKPRELMLR
jgi:hypothetical protein